MSQPKPIVITTSARTRYVLSQEVIQQQQRQQQQPLKPGVISPRQQLPAIHHQQQYSTTDSSGQNNNAAGGSASASLTPRGSARRLLDQNDLRSIRKYVATNKMRPHIHRTGKLKDLVPDSPFEELQERPLDNGVGLTLAPINENESALDVPLRFAAPPSLHAPAVVDVSRGQALGSRLLSTLKGSAGLQPHWAGEKQGPEKDFAHVVMVRDATLKSDAARRSGDAKKFANAQHVLGVLFYNANIKEKALVFFRAAAELSLRANDRQCQALNENLATCSLMHLHRWKEAANLAVQTAQYCGPYGKSVSFNNAGVCHSAVGDYHSAKQCFESALRNAAAANEDSVLDTISRGNLACAQLRLGELPDAQGNFERCLEVCSVAGDSVGSAVILILLAETVGAAGDFKRSVFFFEQALRIANEAHCPELAKLAQTSIGITKATSGVQAMLTSKEKVATNNAVSSKDILASLK